MPEQPDSLAENQAFFSAEGPQRGRPEDISRLGKKSRYQAAFWTMALLSVPIPVAGGMLLHWYISDWSWQNEPLHSVMEVLGAFAGLSLAVLLIHIGKIKGEMGYQLWACCGLLAMGLLDFFHAGSPPGPAFVWFRSSATLVGGLLFALSWVPVQAVPRRLSVFLPVLTVAAVTVFGIASFVLSGRLPAMESQGEFTATAVAIHTLGGAFFLAAALRFLQGFLGRANPDSLLLANFCALQGVAGLVFRFSWPWEADWWWWHLVRLAAYFIALVLTFRLLQGLAEELRQGKLALAQQVRQLQQADEEIHQLNQQLEKRVAERTAQLQAINDQLRDSEALSQGFLEFAPHAIVIVNSQGVITLVNSQAEKQFGYSRQELLGQPIEVLVVERLRDLHPSYRQAYLANPVPRFLTDKRGLVLRRKDGTEIPVEIGLGPVPTKQGLFVMTNIVDITYRKKAEARLRQSETRFRVMIENSLDGICLFDEEGIFRDLTPAIQHILGLQPKELVGRPFSAIVHPEDLPGAMQDFADVVQNPGKVLTVQLRCRHQDGSWRWLEAVGSNHLAEPDVQAIVCNFRDISERRQAEEAERFANNRLRGILEGTKDLIAALDLEFRFISFNRAYQAEFEKIFGKKIELGMNLADTLAHLPQERAKALEIWGRALRGEEFTVTQEFGDAARERNYYEIRYSSIRDEKNKLIGACHIVRDVSAGVRAERELAAAKGEAEKANQAKSDFLSRMSHELRTPLNAVLGFAQLLEMGCLSTEQRDSLGQIRKGGEHLLGLINEVLDIARIESGRLALSPEPVLVADAIQQSLELIRPMADQRGIGLQGALEEMDRGYVWADTQRLRQVLLNLLSNAVKYNQEGGRVTVSASPSSSGRLCIAVSDTGPGMVPEKLNRLFVPFDRLGAEQTGVEGTGLGLALSQGLVEAMNGTLSVTSEVGRGSTFLVELARADGPLAQAAEVSRELAPPRQALPEAHTVLYIEDNLANLTLIEHVLAHRPGIRLLTAMQGRLGLDLACQHCPGLVLLDVHLPDMGGEAVLRQLQANPGTGSIPVVIISADATLRQIERFRALGIKEYLTKPIDVRRLLDIVDRTFMPVPEPLSSSTGLG